VVARRRLDAELVRRGLAGGRSSAAELIASGNVLVNGATADKAARLVAPGDAVVVAAPARYVGRGGEKLDAALQQFAIDVAGRRAVDVGASTGGFTDCLLAHGAREVVSLDVGHGQLHPRLRDDPRVTVLERTNVRAASTATIGGPVDLLVADLSFISLTKVIPTLVSLCHPGSPMVLLVKPQFEAGRVEVARGRGVISDAAVHERVRMEIDTALLVAGCTIVGWMDSPLVGSKGNRELFVHATTPRGEP
jgi:23S rRNA (cytidine1920-2'-O)/16S rRNA (cytidine1409-2'-O)-methyltransferase